MSGREFSVVSEGFELLQSGSQRTAALRPALLVVSAGKKTTFDAVSITQAVEFALVPIDQDSLEVFCTPSMDVDHAAEIFRRFLSGEALRIVWVSEDSIGDQRSIVDTMRRIERKFGRAGLLHIVSRSYPGCLVSVRAVSDILVGTDWTVRLHLRYVPTTITRRPLAGVALTLLELAACHGNRLSFSQTGKDLLDQLVSSSNVFSATDGWHARENAIAYSQFASEFPAYSTVARRLLEFSQIVDADSVADIGCGTGASTLVLRNHLGFGSHIFGYDSSTEMLRVARTRFGSSAAFLPIEEVLDRQHDLIFASAALWQFSRRDIGYIFRHALREGGAFAYNIPSQFERFAPYLCNRLLFEDSIGAHVRSFEGETFEYKSSEAERIAFFNIPIFGGSQSEYVETDRQGGAATQWLMFKVIKG